MLTAKSSLTYALALVENEYHEARSRHNEMTTDPSRQAWVLTREYAEFIRETDLMLRQPMDEMLGYTQRTLGWNARKEELIQVAATATQILVMILKVEETTNAKA